MGYRIGEGFKTHSSTFYNLYKGDKKFLLKLDQTESGSLPHQKIYSQIQAKAGVPFLPVVFLDDNNQYLILEKFEGFSQMADVLDEKMAKLWGETMSRIQNQETKKSCSVWAKEYGEFVQVNIADTVETYLTLAENRMTNLTSEQAYRVKEMIAFIRNNLGKYEQTADDALYLSAFLNGYGDIDLESWYYYILLRGVGRYAFSNFIKYVDLLMDYVFVKLSE